MTFKNYEQLFLVIVVFQACSVSIATFPYFYILERERRLYFLKQKQIETLI